MRKYTLGLDFGTESARAVLVDTANGEIVATAIRAYADGVIDERLPGTNRALAPDWALQNPSDWLASLTDTIRTVLITSGVQRESVVGLGLDFTACTIVPTTADGTPLCTIDQYHDQPHAWAKLWKHHAAQPQADRINALAAKRGESWLPRNGGKISSEWVMPKALQMLEEAPDLYAAAARIVEGGDWVVWQLTGELARNACAAGYKAQWHKREGFPGSDFLPALHSDLADLYLDKLVGPVVAPGTRVGRLSAEWAEKLGLAEGTPVAAALIDAHAGVVGAGISGPDAMFMAMGTSTCHMVMSEREVLVEGMAGVVEDGIVPGLFGYEAGQSGVGDIFAWFVKNGVPMTYTEEATQRGVSVHTILTEKAGALRPGESGLLALDWWNGNRSILMDADLSGLLIGCTLATTPEEIYRALIEGTAFGTRVIIETFTSQGVPVESLTAGGGLTKNELLMHIYADVTGYPISVAASEQAAALGAAMLGAVAAGRSGGGYDSLGDATARMAQPSTVVYRPIPEHVDTYNTLYAAYRRLYDHFGRDENHVMKVLRRLRSS